VSRPNITEQIPSIGVDAVRETHPVNQSIWAVVGRLFVGAHAQAARLSPDDREEITVQSVLRSELLYRLTDVGYCVIACVVLVAAAFRLPGGSPLRETKMYWATLLGVLTVLPFSLSHYSFLLIFPLLALLCDRDEPLERTYALGALCLFLALLHRFWAWLPPLGVLLGFLFPAEVLMGSALVVSALKQGHRSATANARSPSAR
jgi:hypothetical protein